MDFFVSLEKGDFFMLAGVTFQKSGCFMMRMYMQKYMCDFLYASTQRKQHW